ncbi:PREDICTED: ankyrin repeat and KH domain-containing protein mask-like [Rhagoletis zephyria]|uniref:ankyrin repeat and KH domain-containing protein mask-like n=1 Tax=Rhagoletis zephyria TaxID=28612 RepID=UPI00081135CE|nr:PREDICTED: ankyrin repeat and KH domain-containing protein mask-like [Rhagoletis zephyria]
MNNMTGNNNNNSNNNHNNNINSSSSPNYSQISDANSDSKKLAKLKATNLCVIDNKTLSGGNKSERCVLCLDEKRYPVRIPCGHSFCKDCLDVYKSYQKYAWANRCPICRGSMKEKRRLVKRKHSETTDGATATTSATVISSISSSSELGPTRMRLNPSSATIAAATAAAATVTATALSEAAAEATVEQIHFLEEYMAMAVELDVFGTNTGTTFGNAVSISTPTNSASTVSASEAAGEDEEAEELHAADLEANWEQNVGYEQEEFGEGDVEEEDEEALGDDVDVEEDEESDGEDDDEEDGDDEDDDLYFFNGYDDENYEDNDDHDHYDYDTVDEDEMGDDMDDYGEWQDAFDEFYDDNVEGGDDVLFVDEVIIVD